MKVVDVVEVEEDGKVDVNDVVVLLNVKDVVNRVYVEVDANVDVDVNLGVDDLDEGELVGVTADGKVPLKTCDVFAVNDVEGKMPTDQVVNACP